jgi:hypothetical protein
MNKALNNGVMPRGYGVRFVRIGAIISSKFSNLPAVEPYRWVWLRLLTQA